MQAPGVGSLRGRDGAEDPLEEVARFFLDRCRDGSIGIVAVDISAHPAAAEERAADEGGDHAGGQSPGVVGPADHLVDGGAA